MEFLPRTLLLLDEPFVKAGGRYHSRLTWWRLASRFAAHRAACTLYVPPRETAGHCPDLLLEPGRLRFVGGPCYQRLRVYYRRPPASSRRLRRDARQAAAEHDLLLIRLAAPAAAFLVRTARRVVLRPGAQLRHRHPEESQTQ